MTLTKEIRLESLEDGPGLLPFNLGHTRLTSHFHTFLQRIRLDDIEDKINVLHSQILTFETQLPNDTYILYELQIHYLNNKLKSALTQLKGLEPRRVKRGLIDGVGSVIKSLTGNLDYTDAIHYNKVLSNLQASQNKLVLEYNTHVSINKEWTAKQSYILSQLVENQSRINITLQDLLDKEAYMGHSLIKYAKFAQLLSLISENVEDLSNEIVKVENSLAFIQASTMHHSMISIDILSDMIVKLREIYGRPYVLDLELREYYNIIKPGSYFLDKQLVIIYRFPIISADSYDLYKLSIVPNKLHHVLIPPYPFMATNDDSFVYIEAECPKLNTGYLCEEKYYHHVRTQDDCVHQLILKQSLEESCNLTTINLTREAMEKIDDHHYTISLPHPTRTRLTCEREDFMELQGSYLITVPTSCILRTAEFTIINNNGEIKGQPLKIMMIPDIKMLPAARTPRIQLNTINLENLHNIQDKLALQQPIAPDNATYDFIYHTTGPFYGIVVTATIVLCIFAIHRYLKKRRSTVQIKPEIVISNEPNYAEPGRRTQHPGPATFPLNVLK